jgi:hypothetical protein
MRERHTENARAPDIERHVKTDWGCLIFAVVYIGTIVYVLQGIFS